MRPHKVYEIKERSKYAYNLNAPGDKSETEGKGVSIRNKGR